MAIKKILWYVSGMTCLVMAYVGFVVPGIPFSIFLVGAAYSFAKSSEKMHNWLYSHKHFGPFLTNWQEKRIFPTKMKYAMILTMASTLVFTWVATGNLSAILWSGLFMLFVAGWAWRYPGSEEEYRRRKDKGIE